MKTAIYATLLHSISTDAKPQHSKCPAGENSWRFYQSAIANGENLTIINYNPMPLSGEENGCQNYLWGLAFYVYGAALKRDIYSFIPGE
ncbi:hypothetical protein TNCV_1061491 [Trichonephila clavipes]|nr:hypothetical protein TNCV_1061491 [Trichonephila clavipes]